MASLANLHALRCDDPSRFGPLERIGMSVADLGAILPGVVLFAWVLFALERINRM